MAEEHLRQLIYTYARKGKIEPWEYQEIQAVAQRHNVSPGRVQVLITDVVNSIDFQNLPKQTPTPDADHVLSPFRKTGQEAGEQEHILQPFQQPAAARPAASETGWVRAVKKQPPAPPQSKAEPVAENKGNTLKIVLLVILIVLSLYILLGWSLPEKRSSVYPDPVELSEEEIHPEELEKFYNGIYYSNHKRSKTLLVLQLLQVDEARGRALAIFQLNGENYRERAALDFGNRTIRIPKLGTATFYKTNNTVIIESNGSVNPWKIK